MCALVGVELKRVFVCLWVGGIFFSSFLSFRIFTSFFCGFNCLNFIIIINTFLLIVLHKNENTLRLSGLDSFGEAATVGTYTKEALLLRGTPSEAALVGYPMDQPHFVMPQ